MLPQTLNATDLSSRDREKEINTTFAASKVKFITHFGVEMYVYYVLIPVNHALKHSFSTGNVL